MESLTNMQWSSCGFSRSNEVLFQIVVKNITKTEKKYEKAQQTADYFDNLLKIA